MLSRRIGCSSHRDALVRRHVFCSFPAPVLRKELYRRLETAGRIREWSDIKQDLYIFLQLSKFAAV